MNKYRYIILGAIEIIFLIIIIILGVKIKQLAEGKVKGIFVTKINKEDIVFDTNSVLKYFYEPKPNSTETWNPNWLGYEIKNKINSDSLHELHDFPIKKENATFRIIALGDSWTYGVYVEDNENYPTILERLLNSGLSCKTYNKFEVINFGVPGYDIEYTLNRYIKRGAKYNSDLILWLIHRWNFEKINEIHTPLLNQLISEGVERFDPKTRIWASDLITEKLKKERGGNFYVTYQEDKISKLIENINISKLLFVSFSWLDGKYKEIIYNRMKTNPNIFYFDNLINIPNTQYTLLDGHPNKSGHKQIARDLFNYLQENILNECY